MLSHSYIFWGAMVAAAQIGVLAYAHFSFWPSAFFSIPVSCPGFVDVVSLSLTSEYSKGHKRISGRFNNFPGAVRTVAA